ncbi:hypothetical protein E2986_00335 [Frieseomelitta varia]|uniref:Sec1 family domain-containing protein 2 n=1 Tax=Frieseomelitta varia TaxID=561572 RepID=A0A833S0E0_9HYME|nr:sec1 family domain-containing protein 2-like [Frieseomelitta varia]XP_043510184.1 sec1 family domain-containing protein 2-like [Frieseomelitta varia]XP_043510185.1 sec1 family domain-containing protein 2-like [Frieseomelitta varia]XP_043510186.1 sec1 family domain-containing protein 2-like [Frieseomelitta varia]KAF3427320.1 hypothetical protein E2986_00335 [Frieseomelitta varia]
MTDIILEIKKLVSECWTNIFAEVCNAVVYIDHCAIECLHWHTAGKGYLALKDAGAVAVYEFGMYHFRYAEVKNTKKAVIISTSGDPAFYQRTIKMILAKNMFQNCIVYCSVPCSTINNMEILPVEEKLDYIKLKKDIKVWMTSGNLSQEPAVNIVYVPIFIALLNKNLFVTPPFGDLMPPLDINISKDTLVKLNLLAYSFYNLFDSIGVKLDIYSIGKLSDLLAENLENYTSSVNHRNHLSETPEIGVSLILIDRTLDLCTPTSNNTESFLAKILRTFPHLPHHDNDVAVNISPVFGTVTEILESCETPGCLASIADTMMDLLISQKEKKLLSTVNQFLNDMTLIKDSPKLRTPTRISGHSLEKVLNKIQSMNSIDSTIADMEKLQCILAIIKASTSQKADQIELLTSLEKLALQNLSVSRESSSILVQLSNIIRTRVHRGLDIENLLALLVYVYALAGTQIRFSTQQERRLEESIAVAIFEDLETLKKNSLTNTKSAYQRNLLLLGTDDVAAQEASCKIAARILDTLRLIAEQRLTLQDYRFCMLTSSSQEVTRHISILEQITKDIFCVNISRELRDLHKKSSSFISAGFNLILRGKTKRHPRDNSFILIYIVGGITAEEAKIIQEVISANNNEKLPRITLAGSRLLKPLDIVDKIFFS